MKQNKLVIAITGLIGSGKSFLMQILADSGEICIDCDAINRELLSSPEYLDGLRALFPEVFYLGKFDKSILKNLIFHSEEKRMLLNSYAHKKIKEELKKRIESHVNAKRVFVEIPILNQTDSNFVEMFDKVIVVKADKELLLNRITSRDTIDNESAIRILNTQSDNYDFSVPTVVVTNNGDKNALQEQLREILNNG